MHYTLYIIMQKREKYEKYTMHYAQTQLTMAFSPILGLAGVPPLSRVGAQAHIYKVDLRIAFLVLLCDL